MKIILDNDATVVDYRRFVDKHAVPYFKKKYNMNVIHEDKLELEDIFDVRNVLIRRGYSNEDADKQVRRIIDKFWINLRYIAYSSPFMFFPKAARTLRILKKQGHHIEIHTSRMKSKDLNLVGKITRLLMYLQYWGNGCFISCRNFKFYENDDLKTRGIINAFPDMVFEDKPQIIEKLQEHGLKCLCVAGKHNHMVIENRNLKILNSYEYGVVDGTIGMLLGKKKWELYKDIAKSDIAYRKVLRHRHIVRGWFQPIILNEHRLKKMGNRGVVYVSNHRRTLDPIVITAIINEPIRYAALKRFFDAQDSIFSNNKNFFLCRFTASVFKSLRFFPIERVSDYDDANNIQSIKNMVEYANIKGKIGIFPEGTTLKNPEKDFNEFNDAFVKLAALTGSVIQPITVYWFEHEGKRKCVINFGNIIEVQKDDMHKAYTDFIQCQKGLLSENKNVAKKYSTKHLDTEIKEMI